MGTSDAPGSSWIGRRLDDRYAVTAELGRGGMGTVYLATDERMDRPVVIKVPEASLLGVPGFRERFELETRSLVQLVHPHIVTVHDGGAEDGVPYLVLQHLGGGSLKDRIDEAGGRLTPGDVERWLPDVARALDFIHELAVVHRDVKPGNILFDEYGQVYLADFGIAKALGGQDTGLTQTGMTPGTPDYIAPEAVKEAELRGTSDQYALGGVVYRCLAGRVPITATTPMGVIVKKVNEDPPPLVEVAPDVGPAVSEVVGRVLSREPEARYESCLAFAEAFRSALLGRTTEGTAAGIEPTIVAEAPGGETGTVEVSAPGSGAAPETRIAPERPREPAAPEAAGAGHRLTRPVQLAVLAVVLVGIGVGAWALLAGGANRADPGPAAPTPAPPRLVVASPQPARLVSERVLLEGRVENAGGEALEVVFNGREPFRVSPDDGSFDIERELEEGETAARLEVRSSSGEVLDARTIPLTVDRTPPVLEIEGGLEHVTSDEEIVVRGTVKDEHPGKKVFSGPEGYDVVDGRFAIPVSLGDGESRNLRLVAEDAVGNRSAPVTVVVRRKVPAPEASERLRRCFDLGIPERLAVSEKGRIRWVDVLGDRVRRQHGPVRAVAFLGPGEVVAGGENGRPRFWDLATGREESRRFPAASTFGVHALAVRDGTIAYATTRPVEGGIAPEFRPVVRVCSADGRVRDIEVVDEMVRSLAFAADGKKLAWGSENAVGLLDLSTGRSLWRRTDKKWSGMRVALSPDGSLVFAARIEEREVLLLSAADGDTVRTIEAASDIHAIAVVPTLASRLVTVGDNLQVWDGPSGAEVRKPVYIGLGVPALGAGGGRFASGGMFGDVRVWEAGTGRELRSWSDAGARTVGDLDAVESIALSPDGKLVATGHRSGRIRVRVVATGKEILAPGSPPLESWLFVASPDGEWIASAGREGTPRVRVSSRDAEPRDFPGYAGALLAGPEGSWLATSILDPDRSGSRRTLLRIVQPRSGAKLRDVTQIDLFSPLLSLRGAIVGQLHEAAGREGRGAIRLFGARSVSDDRDLIQNPEGRLALVMPDASHIVTVADDAQLVWSTESSQVVARREGAYRRIEWHDHGNLTALIPQKGWVVSIRKDDAGTIHLWAFRTGRILRMLPGHRTRRVAVLPDGRTLVSSGDDCTMRLWDAETGTLLDKIATDGSPTCLAVQGRTIWAVFPGVIHRYDVAPAGD